jgi:alpha-N-arabinofuranosidase
MNRSVLFLVMASAALLSDGVSAAKFDRVQVLANGGFESGDLVERASDFFPVGRWSTSDAGVNELAANKQHARSGQWSMKHGPIGWGQGDDKQVGTDDDDDAVAVVFNKCRDYVSDGARRVTFEGYADVSELDPEYQVHAALLIFGQEMAVVGLANSGQIRGGTEGWQTLKATAVLPDSAQVTVALLVVDGTARRGAPADSAVYYDDVSLTYGPATGTDQTPAKTRAVLTDDYTANVRVTDTVLNTLRPEIFGDNIEWTNNGMGLYFPDKDRFDTEVLALLRDAGITHLRYPGGTLSDFFVWHDAVGQERKEIPNPFAEPVKGKPEFPNFGPEEFARLCQAMGVRATVTLNAGTGTPEQAAEVVRWCGSHGLDVIDYTVGNEIYMVKPSEEPVPDMPIAKSPEEYVAFYKSCDDAIRAFAPDVKIGAIGGLNTGLIPLTAEPDWLRIVIKELGDRIDFIDLHNAYAPVLRNVGYEFDRVTTDDEYAATFMAATEYVRDNLAATKDLLRRCAPDHEIEIHVTEYGPLVYPFRPGKPEDKVSDMAWNRNLAGALYLASLFHLFAEEPLITSANHMPLYQGGFGALVGLEWHPTDRRFWRNAVYPVFQTYAGLAGREVMDVVVEGPTFDALPGGFVPALPSVPLLDAAAFRSAEGRLELMLVNRSIGGAATVTIDASQGMRFRSAEFLAADDFHAENSVAAPDTIRLKPLPGGQIVSQTPLTVCLPKHSLTVLRFERP